MENNSDLKETILVLIHDSISKNIKLYSSPKMKERIFDNVFELLTITIFQDDLCDLIYDNIDYYFSTVGHPRSIIPTKIIKEVDQQKIENHEDQDQRQQGFQPSTATAATGLSVSGGNKHIKTPRYRRRIYCQQLLD